MHVPNLSYLGDIKTALHSYQAGLDLPYLIERVGQRRKKDGAIDVGSRIPLRLESLSHKRQDLLDGASLSDKRTAHEEFAERAEGRKSVFLREGLQLARLWGYGRVIATKRFTNQGEIQGGGDHKRLPKLPGAFESMRVGCSRSRNETLEPVNCRQVRLRIYRGHKIVLKRVDSHWAFGCAEE